VSELTTEVASLRAAVQAARAPETASPVLAMQMGDGRFTVNMGAFAQLRLLLRTDEVLENLDEASMILERARLRWNGQVYSDALTYKIMLDFGKGNAELIFAALNRRIRNYFIWGVFFIALAGGVFMLISAPR
jgi:hypothetical protein